MAKKKEKTVSIGVDIDFKHESTLKAFALLLKKGIEQLTMIEKKMKKGDSLYFESIELSMKIKKAKK